MKLGHMPDGTTLLAINEHDGHVYVVCIKCPEHERLTNPHAIGADGYREQTNRINGEKLDHMMQHALSH